MKYDVTVERTITQELTFTVEAEDCNEAGIVAEQLGQRTEHFIDIPVTARGHHAVVIARLTEVESRDGLAWTNCTK